jgi:uncharacterized RDD family membrane protein YckC
MPYCRNCGFKIPDGASYCPNCGASVPQEFYRPQLEFASWGERIAAYIIDVIILGIIIIPIASVWGFLQIWTGATYGLSWSWTPFVSFGIGNFISFLYWTFMEGVYGQSIGKIILKIKVTTLEGAPIDITSAAIESVGKAFLLPIDLILGLILYPQKNQRLFNYISNTIVIKVR